MLADEPSATAVPVVADSAIYDEFLSTDAVTGERKRIGLADKEKLYLSCIESFYLGGEAVLGDEEFDQLKEDLSFEGSEVVAFSQNEIKFLIANKNYQAGNPTLSDADYDKLRKQLRSEGSVVVLHDAPTCRVDTGVCKMDARVDEAKQRLLYFPGTAAGLVLLCELSFWTLHIDPLLSLAIAALPSYFFGVWFTENVFAQKPLVASSACPECNYLLTIYFGDLFNVQSEGAAGPPQPEVDLICPSCKCQLKASRDTMIVQTLPKVIS